ncbi:hypothetical protein MA3A0122S_0077 [Mycobacteroides abscessus 3A-0122-S]|nr:hypothetical protein MA3A0122S_0077 [Mycobacteroides abscessus 3A-0122-S]ETZ70085.1 hypothetical protein L835_2998 [Mycobacteroides abscessus MAB_110811_1470]
MVPTATPERQVRKVPKEPPARQGRWPTATGLTTTAPPEVARVGPAVTAGPGVLAVPAATAA